MFVIDLSLSVGLIKADGSLLYAQTMAFTTLTMFQLVNTLNARSYERSAFSGVFSDLWLRLVLGVSLVLQVMVVYVPILQSLLDGALEHRGLADMRRQSQVRSYGCRSLASS